MNAYTFEIEWSTTERCGVSFIYAEGATKSDAANLMYKNLKRQGVTATTLLDTFAHAECDKLQPCKNGIL